MTISSGGDWLPAGNTLTGRWSIIAPVSMRANLSGSCATPVIVRVASLFSFTPVTRYCCRKRSSDSTAQTHSRSGVSLYAVVTVICRRPLTAWMVRLCEIPDGRFSWRRSPGLASTSRSSVITRPFTALIRPPLTRPASNSSARAMI